MISSQVDPCIFKQRAISFQLSLLLVQNSLERARIDLRQKVPFLDVLSFCESDLQQLPDRLLPAFDELGKEDCSPEEQTWLKSARALVISGSHVAAERVRFAMTLADQCEKLSEAAYDFLFDPTTGLLHIGYNADEQRKDSGCYDLLASEMRLGIFAGIALGKLPRKSWFSPGRLLVRAGGGSTLASWSGSMFEYLMPELVMPSYDNTLLTQTNTAAVKTQIEYAHQQSVPWGISEAAYNMVDAGLNYQYRAFGIPGLMRPA